MEEKIAATDGEVKSTKPNSKNPTANNSIDATMSPEHISVMD